MPRTKKSAAQLDREIREHCAIGRMTYRDIGNDGDPWPEWLRKMRHCSGVYVIRTSSGTAIYAGSSKGRLYDTVTRHFQQWRRSGGTKNWWLKTGAYRSPAGHDPGVTYKRKGMVVGVQICDRDKVLEIEAELIERLKPRDNMVQNPHGDDDDIPF